MGRGLIGFASAILIALVVLIVLVNCGGPERDGSTLGGSIDYQVDSSSVSPFLEVTRYIDKEAGVVCYSINKGGIDCLPIAKTKLDIRQ